MKVAVDRLERLNAGGADYLLPQAKYDVGRLVDERVIANPSLTAPAMKALPHAA